LPGFCHFPFISDYRLLVPYNILIGTYTILFRRILQNGLGYVIISFSLSIKYHFYLCFFKTADKNIVHLPFNCIEILISPAMDVASVVSVKNVCAHTHVHRPI